ncbi:hypothetical protein GCM10027038_26500 [Arthrobacter bambusae]
MMDSGVAPGCGGGGKKTGAFGLPALSSLLFPTGPDLGIWAQELRTTMRTARTAITALNTYGRRER